MHKMIMERKRTFTMNWDALHLHDDDHFFESQSRISSAAPHDREGSSDDDEEEDFNECRMSFSTVGGSSFRNYFKIVAVATAESHSTTPEEAPPAPDYDPWEFGPGTLSISERRKKLLQAIYSSKIPNGVVAKVTRIPTRSFEQIQVQPEATTESGPEHAPQPDPDPDVPSSPVTVVLVRSRSEGEIEAFSADKLRKKEVIRPVSRQRLKRTSSAIAAPQLRICPYAEVTAAVSTPKNDAGGGRAVRSGGVGPVFPNYQVGAFLLIKNLDNGTEFIVNEFDQNGCYSDLQTGEQLTMDEFEKLVGYSPLLKEMMRRQNVKSGDAEAGSDRKTNSFVPKSLRTISRKQVEFLKNRLKGMSRAVSVLIRDKDQHALPPPPPPPLPQDQKSGKNSESNSSEWVKVRHSGKSYKELSALHMCQEIPEAHKGSIWTIKFSLDARFLASAGEDRVIHVWEVQECEIMSMDSNSTPLHHSFCQSPDRSSSSPSLSSDASITSEKKKKKKGKGGSARKTNPIPDYVHAPKFVFALSEKPVCTFEGHLDAVLDLSWSRDQLLLSSSMDKTVRLWDMETKTCIKMFAHNDFGKNNMLQFNPLDDNYFLSGSLDAKIRLWDIPDRRVVDWTDLHEMITAACYTPDGQAAIIGSHKGNCRLYNAEDSKLSQEGEIDLKYKKKSRAKKITGFQFSPINLTEMLVTSADSRIRIVDGKDVTHKFKGFRNTVSQIGASFTPNGKYVICASEDSNVFVWKHDASATAKKPVTVTSHEHFECKDVSVAIPWPGTVKGDPPPVHVQASKRHSKRSNVQPISGTASPNQNGGDNKKQLPPLPRKDATMTNPSTAPNMTPERPSTPPPEEEDPPELSRTESGTGKSFSSMDPSSIRYSADSPSISAGNASSSWSSSWSWFDIGGSQSSQTTQASAWGMVIVTATLEGEIRAYQNFGLPRRVQNNLFGGPT